MASDASKLFSYCASLYNAMAEKADPNTHAWSGRLMAICTEAGIPNGSYKRVVDRLREMGCIEQVERGYRGTALSVFVVHYPPTAEVWDRFVKSSREGLTSSPSLDSLYAEVRDVQAFINSLGGLDIVEAVRNLDNRIKVLEALASNDKNNNN